MLKFRYFVFASLLVIINISVSAQTSGSNDSAKDRVVSFGTILDPNEQILESEKLGKSLANPESEKWQAKGDQHRTYTFPGTNEKIGYRIYVPTTWDENRSYLWL